MAEYRIKVNQTDDPSESFVLPYQIDDYLDAERIASSLTMCFIHFGFDELEVDIEKVG